MADLILAALPSLERKSRDRDHVLWYAELMQLVEQSGRLPIAYADYFDDSQGWEVGWGSGVRHPAPPPPV